MPTGPPTTNSTNKYPNVKQLRWAINYIGPHLQEAEEEGVDGHRVDGEEGGGDQVGGHRDQQGRQEREVELGQLLSHLLLIGDIEGQRRNR